MAAIHAPPQWTAGSEGGLRSPRPSTRILCDHFEVGEAPRVLGHGRWGPVVRARDMRTKRLVAIKVFNPVHAYRAGEAAGCGNLHEAQQTVEREFGEEVRALQRNPEDPLARSQ